MQDHFLKSLHTTLSNCIKELDTIHDLFVQHPGRDFSRNRKISFSDICWFLIGLQGKSMPNEILDFFDHSISVPSSSAFIQQRKKNPDGGLGFPVSFFHTGMHTLFQCYHVWQPYFRG